MALPDLTSATSARSSRGFLAALLSAVLTTACMGAEQPVAQVSSVPSPTALIPASSPRPVLPPASYLPGAAAVGLPQTSARDHVGYLQAASEERNQATALELYVTFDWADEALRTYGAGSRRIDVKVLVTKRVVGARNAFLYWSGLAHAARLKAVPCPAGSGLDQCAAGRSPSGAVAAGRSGVVVFYIEAVGIDIEGPLRLVAGVVSAGSPA